MTSAQTETAGLQVLQAFETAIRSGRLSRLPTAENYAGFYMYMGHQDGIDLFKHIDTRHYIV
jgi:hypothetical protein